MQLINVRQRVLEAFKIWVRVFQVFRQRAEGCTHELHRVNELQRTDSNAHVLLGRIGDDLNAFEALCSGRLDQEMSVVSLEVVHNDGQRVRRLLSIHLVVPNRQIALAVSWASIHARVVAMILDLVAVRLVPIDEHATTQVTVGRLLVRIDFIRRHLNVVVDAKKLLDPAVFLQQFVQGVKGWVLSRKYDSGVSIFFRSASISDETNPCFARRSLSSKMLVITLYAYEFATWC